MEDEISDFFEFAYEKGKVKDAKEAFYEYSPNEEWHHGKIENIVHNPKKSA